MTCLRIALVAGLIWIGAAAATPGQAPRAARAPGAAVALAADLEVEQTQLEEDLERYDRLNRKRSVVEDRLSELHRSLDAAVRSGAGVSPEQMDALLEQVGQAEAERTELAIEFRGLVETIRDRRRRVVLLEEQLELIRGRTARDVGLLTGNWDVTLMPLEQRGSFVLYQTGTLLSGTYQLAGGWTGSLQGTLVDRKVYLVRIDSKLGRMMELEGFLASDGDSIRGSWLSYELAGGEGSTGQWSARRQEDEEAR